MRFLLGDIMPLMKTESLKGAIWIIGHHLCMTLEEKRERPPGSADINGLPKSVQNQHVLIQKGTHKSVTIVNN